ncbi:MAG TPA: cation:proton antiporter [Thermoanaerobaculia bacterium]|nr:cation:proton antiporter [Thermoanaerobaculia bacterium]
MTTRAFFNLLMIGSLAYAARSFLPEGQTVTGSGAALAFGFLLIASLQIARFADHVKTPHLTGYLLCGLFFGPQGIDIITQAMLDDLALIKGTAVGLIALLAGCELNFRKLRPMLRAITSISIVTMGLCILLLWVLFFWITSLLPATQGYGFVERAGIALVAANVLAAFSPAVVIGLIRETRAAGPLSQLCMSIVVLADLAMVVAFSITTSFVRTAFPSSQPATGVGTLVDHIFGSILVGLVIGGVLVVYVRRVHSKTGLVVFALLFIVAEAGRVFHLDPLLVGLTAGLLLENASDISGDEIVKVTEPVTLPTFVIFFAVVGAEIQLRAFLHVAPFAVAAALVRAFGVFVGAKIGSRMGKVDEGLTNLIPLGLLPQAGVAIALAVLVLNDFEPWGRVVGTVLLGSIVVNQLIAPILFRVALAKAGEIGAAPG